MVCHEMNMWYKGEIINRTQTGKHKHFNWIVISLFLLECIFNGWLLYNYLNGYREGDS